MLRLTVAPLFIAIIFCNISLSAEKLTCDGCQKNIRDGEQYSELKSGDKTIFLCKTCSEKLRKAMPKCALCHKELTGKVVMIERNGKKLRYHEKCYKSMDKCKRCNAPVKKGKKYCEDCLKNSPKCSICHKPLDDGSVSYKNGDSYCKECLETYPRCGICKRPIDGEATMDAKGKIICATCHDRVKICSCCGEVITGTYYDPVFTEGIYCKKCDRTRPKCKTCGRPIKGEPIMVGGKRPTCPECFKSVVLSDEKIDSIFTEVKDMLKSEFNQSVKHELPLKMIDDIGEEREKAGFSKSSGKELGLFRRVGDNFTIFILFGLTRGMAYETVPHEWTHAWCAENADTNHPQWVEEGFCQWVASKILQKKGYETTLKILENRRDLYGKGYRYIHDLEKKLGSREAVLNYMRNPPGKDAPAKAKNE